MNHCLPTILTILGAVRFIPSFPFLSLWDTSQLLLNPDVRSQESQYFFGPCFLPLRTGKVNLKDFRLLQVLIGQAAL